MMDMPEALWEVLDREKFQPQRVPVVCPPPPTVKSQMVSTRRSHGSGGLLHRKGRMEE